MPYLYNTPEDQAAMLAAIGAELDRRAVRDGPGRDAAAAAARDSAGHVARWSSRST